MPKDKTVRTNIGAPKFGINEIVYARESATKGFIEPLTVARIAFNRARNLFEYRFRQGRVSANIAIVDGVIQEIPVRAARNEELIPVILLEDKILTFCEAIGLVESFLTNELSAAEDEQEIVCGTNVEDPFQPEPGPAQDAGFVTRPLEPKFSINEIVYLDESAQGVGRLEKMRIDDIRWDEETGKWRYTAYFNQKPGENATVGDRVDLRRNVVVEKLESELITLCEAIRFRVQFLTRTLNKVTNKRVARCGTE